MPRLIYLATFSEVKDTPVRNIESCCRISRESEIFVLLRFFEVRKTTGQGKYQKS